MQFRTVRTTGASPADSSELQAFSDLDCAHPAVMPPAQVVTACDAQGHKYLLDPAAFTGGVASAQAEPGTDDGVDEADVVTVRLDPSATTALAEVSRRLTRTHGLLALVVGGRVVAAPEVVSPISTGSLEIQVPGATRTSAEALAAQLTS